MADLLIKHLKAKAQDHSALEVLVNQWGFDENLIPKALQGIGTLFPHYSRHDESHSKQILVNIERLLGENIADLTAIDTWLLLEAAYWHDIGMVVPQSDMQDAFDDPAFDRYLAKINNSPNHELYRFCQHFDKKDASKCFSGADNPLDAVTKFLQLMAEWFRRGHPERARHIARSPWERIGLKSPRTELIPTRLFILLGQICHMHGLPFQTLLSAKGLPYRAAGLAQEDCHPRFIACLLRMGDLLDMDDNRFCPVMQKIAGDERPAMTKAHEDKHASIRHLRMDKERIEVMAECESIDGYLETYKWFDWLKQEVQNQMAHWADIVPNRKFGLLPTLGTMRVTLQGNQQLLADGQRPQFTLDSEQAIALLQGANLYFSKFSCIRELLQNAIDATLLRLWITNKKAASEWKNPLDAMRSAAFQEAFIEVELEEDKEAKVKQGESAWLLRITDKGIGIRREDLHYMLNIGGSRENYAQKEKIKDIHDWMKPSGTFGIGLQSVFMLTDKIRLTTKDIFSNEITKITMYDPKGEKGGLVLIETHEPDILKPHGTTLEISLKLDNRLGLRKRVGSLYDASFEENRISLLDEDIPFDASSLMGYVKKFSTYIILPIKVSFKGKVLSEYLGEYQKEDCSYKFIQNSPLLLTYKPVSVRSRDTYSKFTTSIITRYRGQEFSNNCFSRYLMIEVDLLSGNAEEWVAISREKIASNKEEELMKVIFVAIKEKIGLDLDNSEVMNNLEDEQKKVLSFFLRLQSLKDKSWQPLAAKLGDDWKRLSFAGDDAKNYASFSEKDEWIMSKQVDVKKNGDDLLLDQFGHDLEGIKTVYIDEWTQSNDQFVTVLPSSCNGTKQLRYRFFKEDKAKVTPALYTEESLATALIGAVDKQRYNMRYTLCFEECVSDRESWQFGEKEWGILYLNQDLDSERVEDLFDIPTRNNRRSYFVLLPFLFLQYRIAGTSFSDLDKLVERIRPHLETDSSPETIRRKYEELIDYIDNTIMKPSPFWEEWRKARGIKDNTTESKE